MPAIRSPCGLLVVSGIAGNLNIPACRELVNVDVEIRCSRPLPGKRNLVAIGRPCGRGGMPAFFDEASYIRPIGIHDVNLRLAISAGGESDFSAGLGVPE